MTTEFELKELSPQSRFSIHDHPLLPPATCFICGAGDVDDRKFLDFGKQVKWYGAIYFCSLCVREISEALGFYPAEMLQTLMKANEEFSKNNEILKTLLREANESHRTIARTLASCTCGPDGPYGNADEDVESDSGPELSDSKSLKLDRLEGSWGVHGDGDDE